jgi:hypothetical protein
MQTRGPIPRHVRDAYELDKKNGNTKWQDAMQEEINGKLKYLTGFKNIRVHFVFAVNHDLCQKT